MPFLRTSLAALAALFLLSSVSAGPPTVDPTYGLRPPRRQSIPRPPATARWIWAAATADAQTIHLRRAFTVRAVPKTATLYVTADNFFTLFVNGKNVDESRPDPKDGNVWQHVHQINIAPFLTAGANVLAVQAVNADGPAGVAARLEMPKTTPLETDAHWKVFTETSVPGSWTSAAFDDSAWQAAKEVGALTDDPWKGGGGLHGWPGYDADAPYLAHKRLPVARVLDIHPGAGKLVGARSLLSGGLLTVTAGLRGRPAGSPSACWASARQAAASRRRKLSPIWAIWSGPKAISRRPAA